jgi:hypothetical protein
MQFFGNEFEIGRLFFWIVVLSWCLICLSPKIKDLKLDTPGVHLSASDEKGRKLNFLLIESADDSANSWHRLRGWLTLLKDRRYSVKGPDPEALKRPNKLIIVRLGASVPKQPLQVDVPAGEPYRPDVLGGAELMEELYANGPNSLMNQLNQIIGDWV